MAMSHQLSLRVPGELRETIRARLEEMRRAATRPEELTEADAARALIEEGAKAKRGMANDEAE